MNKHKPSYNRFRKYVSQMITDWPYVHFAQWVVQISNILMNNRPIWWVTYLMCAFQDTVFSPSDHRCVLLCHSHNPVLLSFINCHTIFDKGDNSGTGIDTLPEHLNSTTFYCSLQFDHNGINLNVVLYTQTEDGIIKLLFC